MYHRHKLLDLISGSLATFKNLNYILWSHNLKHMPLTFYMENKSYEEECY
jgi:hypothetical protein